MKFQKPIQLLENSGASYVLLRYPHILKRSIQDIDVLFETNRDYNLALHIFKKEGYAVLEKEKYRTFFFKKERDLLLIDCYKEVSWLGQVFLDKSALFRRRKKIGKGIIVPSAEDELMIYVGQGIFRNFGFDSYKWKMVKELKRRAKDWNYIEEQTKSFTWNWLFQRALKKRKVSRICVLLDALLKSGFELPRRALRRLASLFRNKTTTICLIGPDGAGKSTIMGSLSESCCQLFSKFNPDIKMLYFGWKPVLPFTKLASFLLKKRKINVVKKSNRSKPLNWLLSQALFVYLFKEYLFRHTFAFTRRKRQIILIDRYFYDVYAHYDYAQNSRIMRLLLKLYPKPDYLFFVCAPLDELLERKNDVPKERIVQHINRYAQIAEKFGAPQIDTVENSLPKCVNKILDTVYKTACRRMR